MAKSGVKKHRNADKILVEKVVRALSLLEGLAKGNFEELQKGIQRIDNLIFSESYHLEKAITHASKAAYMAILIKNNAVAIDKFDNLQQLKDCTIGEPLNTKLNKLKKSNPEAFFYWYKIYEIQK